MTYSEIVDQVKFQAREQSFTAVRNLIDYTVNEAYRSAVRKLNFRELQVYGEEFDTQEDTQTYTAPYPLLQLIPDGFLFNYQSDYNLGMPLKVMVSSDMIQQANWFGQGINPMGVCIRGSIGTALYSTGSASIANQGTAVTGIGTTWTSDMVGEWMQFGYSSTSSASGGNYGYKIAAFGSTTSLTLEEAYRGPSLVQAQYSIRPASTPQIYLAPAFTNFDTTCRYTWLRAPRRLYNEGDTPEVDQIDDYLISEACASCAQYNNDVNQYNAFKAQSRERLKDLIQQFAF